jgi:light-regulated signal transduction histidine kinase (bacteriophytochrome)
LIDGILTLSRSTRGELRREPVDLSALARRLLMEHQQAEPARRVDWEVQPGLDAQGAPPMLEAVMVNLIDNAWKYTAKTAAATIRFDAEDQAGERWFRVTDNGAGFDMAYAERLFKPFQRLHRQDEFPGIGIGLATVQRIIHRHGGTIAAVGAPGQGATFRFTLTAAATRQESS